MFGFNKKKKETNKKQSRLDKVLMGVIVGGAIGSVLGIGFAPKKGSDTRKDIGKQANKILKSAKDIVSDKISQNNLIKKNIKKTATFGNKALPDEK